MAPNLKHRPILLQTAAGLDLQDVKAFPPLTSQEQPSQQKQKGVETIRASPKQDSSNYWEWSGDQDEELKRLAAEEQAEEKARKLTSADHIVDNLVRQAASERVTPTVAANDQYWDWSPAQESANYWDWPSSKDAQRELVREFDATQTKTVVAPEGASDTYWDW